MGAKRPVMPLIILFLFWSFRKSALFRNSLIFINKDYLDKLKGNFVMFRSILSIAKPVQLMSRQLLNKPFTPVLPILMNRCFSESVKPEETVEKETENDVAEEVKEQVIHNQFSHVFLLDFMSFMI